MKLARSLILFIIIMISFNGCEKKDPSELNKVHWDRDMCERCKMVVSERHHAVQVINLENGRSYMFDDIGCVVLWFDDEKIDWAPKAKIWITDVTTGKWIDARKAFYDTSNITPMAYGLAAHKSKESIKKGEEIVNFEEMSKRIFKIEANKNRKAY
jgi:nitrous oxide reductase accessory protein NosL